MDHMTGKGILGSVRWRNTANSKKKLKIFAGIYGRIDLTQQKKVEDNHGTDQNTRGG